MKRWFFHNLGLKVLALLIALVLWAYVGSRQVIDTRATLHLELTDIPVGMTVDPTLRSSLLFTFTGRKESVLDLDRENLRAVMSLKDVKPSDKELFVHPAIRVEPLPKGISVTVLPVTVHLLPISVKTKRKK